MYAHTDTTHSLFRLIKSGEVKFGGNRRLKIYGTLACTSGKRMSKRYRVFFSSVAEAIDHGFRPCGHCLTADYKRWKMSKNRVENEAASSQFCFNKKR